MSINMCVYMNIGLILWFHTIYINTKLIKKSVIRQFVKKLAFKVNQNCRYTPCQLTEDFIWSCDVHLSTANYTTIIATIENLPLVVEILEMLFVQHMHTHMHHAWTHSDIANTRAISKSCKYFKTLRLGYYMEIIL